MRRRIYHTDVGASKFEYVDRADFNGLNEPLLRNDTYGDSKDKFSDNEAEDDVSKGRRDEERAWSNIFSGLIVQWAQWFANLLLGSGTLLSGIFFRSYISIPSNNGNSVGFDLSPLQKERLQKLQQRLEVPFDGTLLKHQNALKKLWRISFPNTELKSLVSQQWKEMGWQGTDPSTDFRGAGYISLENLLFYADKFPKSFQRLLLKQEGQRSTWEYPFAVAGINISFMLIQMLDLRSVQPSSCSGIQFLKLLAEDEEAFDMLYCVAFEILDSLWLSMKASYMEFNEVMKSTKLQLEKELSLSNVRSVQDMPAFQLLML